MSRYLKEAPIRELRLLVEQKSPAGLVHLLLEYEEKVIRETEQHMTNLTLDHKVPLIARYAHLQNVRDTHQEIANLLRQLLGTSVHNPNDS